MLSKQIPRKTISKSENTSGTPNNNIFSPDFTTPHDIKMALNGGKCGRQIESKKAHGSFINLDDPNDFEDSATVRFK